MAWYSCSKIDEYYVFFIVGLLPKTPTIKLKFILLYEGTKQI